MDTILEDDNENRMSGAVLGDEIVDHFAQVEPVKQEFKVD
jgi:hypothetical protein